MIVPNPTIPYTTVYCPPMTYGLIISHLSVFVKIPRENEDVRYVYRILLKGQTFCGIIIMWKYRATARKEIDHEKTYTDIIIRANVYGMRWYKQ